MIKVLHIINGADLGGISTLLLNYYRNMDRGQFHFDFIYSTEGPLGYNGRELQKLGCEFYYVPKKSQGFREHIDGVEKIIRQNLYDVIHVHSNLTSYVTLAVAKRNKVHVRIAHAHNAIFEKVSIKGIVSRLLGMILNNHYATIRLACSRNAAEYMFGKRAINQSNTMILPNSIEVERFFYSEDTRNKLRQKMGINQKDIVFGSVGRMTDEKNMIFLVDVLSKIGMENVKLLIVGDGPDRMIIQEKAKEYGLSDRVVLPGQQSNVNEILSVFDVFVVPSKNEGFSIAALEAGANGLPIVFSDAVPSDVGFFPMSVYLPLHEGASRWAEEIINRVELRYKNGPLLIKEHGFDIKDTVKKLQDIYRGKVIY